MSLNQIYFIMRVQLIYKAQTNFVLLKFLKLSQAIIMTNLWEPEVSKFATGVHELHLPLTKILCTVGFSHKQIISINVKFLMKAYVEDKLTLLVYIHKICLWAYVHLVRGRGRSSYLRVSSARQIDIPTVFILSLKMAFSKGIHR